MIEVTLENILSKANTTDFSDKFVGKSFEQSDFNLKSKKTPDCISFFTVFKHPGCP
jgi:hypothetical protein